MSTEMKAILMIDQKQMKMEQRMDRLEYDIPLYGSEADELSSHVKRKGVSVLGGKQSEAYKDTEIRSKVYRDNVTIRSRGSSEFTMILAG